MHLNLCRLRIAVYFVGKLLELKVRIHHHLSVHEKSCKEDIELLSRYSFKFSCFFY